MRGVFTCAHVHACAFTNDHERAQSQARIARSFGSSARWRPGHRDLVLKSAKIDACASDREAISMAAAPTGPWDFADNGRRENPTTPSWYSCIIGPGSIFQIVILLPCRPAWRAPISSRERVTVKNDRVSSNGTSRIQSDPDIDPCIMVDSTQFNRTYVLAVRASCGGGKKAESRRRVSVNALALLLLVG